MILYDTVSHNTCILSSSIIFIHTEIPWSLWPNSNILKASRISAYRGTTETRRQQKLLMRASLIWLVQNNLNMGVCESEPIRCPGLLSTCCFNVFFSSICTPTNPFLLQFGLTVVVSWIIRCGNIQPFNFPWRTVTKLYMLLERSKQYRYQLCRQSQIASSPRQGKPRPLRFQGEGIEFFHGKLGNFCFLYESVHTFSWKSTWGYFLLFLVMSISRGWVEGLVTVSGLSSQFSKKPPDYSGVEEKGKQSRFFGTNPLVSTAMIGWWFSWV